MEINGEKTVILTLPYPSEKRLNEVFTEELGEEERQRSYSERINGIFSKLSEKYRDDTVNIAVSHIYITGGEGTESERPIQLGGSLAVDECCLPQKAQYIALGHLHKPQRVSSKLNAYYAGSPIQYSKSEINYSKCSYIVDVKAGGEAKVEEVLFRNYKPIEVFECSSIEDALNKCRENKGRKIWAYLDIETDRVLTQSEIKEMKELIPDIVEIVPKMKDIDAEVAADSDMRNKSMSQLFKEFYKSQRKAEASEEIMDVFLDIVKEDGEGDEAKEA
jgi:exonuclease SbcD